MPLIEHTKNILARDLVFCDLNLSKKQGQRPCFFKKVTDVEKKVHDRTIVALTKEPYTPSGDCTVYAKFIFGPHN